MLFFNLRVIPFRVLLFSLFPIKHLPSIIYLILDIIWIITHNFATYSSICYILSPKEKAAKFDFMRIICIEFITLNFILPAVARNDFAVVLRLRDIHFIASIRMRVVCSTADHLTVTNCYYSPEYNAVIFSYVFLTSGRNGTYIFYLNLAAHKYV